ncbi:ATPase [Rhodobacteraceae bacterium RKSG542]|uniref:ATP12 family chaperone protein n=1 Tax=Pseudovibrio flavus TaxID=2529854 RepID=UPI0012BCF0F7|nr:ATP12 family protein [Pseudovibrio flavus]MTI16422.1 ATPase [Pseudovibrio flavus]
MREIFEQLAEDIAKGPVDPVERAKELSRRELPKRFYELVSVEERDGAFAILLDGRTVKTPGRRALSFDREHVAEAVAAEWELQDKMIDPATMPLTRLAHSAIDAVADRFDEVADEVTRYAGNDAVCYRADAPQELVARQTQHWDPVVAWANERLGGKFQLIGGLIHQPQEEVLLKNYREALNKFTPLELSAIHTVTSITGSALFALGLAEKAFDDDAVWAAAFVDEDWNAEQWGQDSEAIRVRNYKQDEFLASALVLADTPEEIGADVVISE